MSKKPKTVRDIVPDNHNANAGTERGRAALEKSLRNLGAGRSILVDKHGRAIAGNKTLEVAAELGLPIEVVETDGSKLVVVQRKDLDLDKDPRARELAYADNRVAELDLSWDVEVLKADMEAGLDLSGFFSDKELELLTEETKAADSGGGTAGYTGDADSSGAYREQYGVIVLCRDEEEQAAIYEGLTAEGLACKVVVT